MIRRRFTLILLLTLVLPAAGFAQQPVIDMHFHAWPYGESGAPDTPKNLAEMRRLLDSLREDVTQKLSQIRPLTPEEQQAMLEQIRAQQAMAQAAAAGAAVPAAAAAGPEPGKAIDGFVEDDPSTWGNPGRNDTCPCGSGKKFKHCHGRLA